MFKYVQAKLSELLKKSCTILIHIGVYKQELGAIHTVDLVNCILLISHTAEEVTPQLTQQCCPRPDSPSLEIVLYHHCATLHTGHGGYVEGFIIAHDMSQSHGG